MSRLFTVVLAALVLATSAWLTYALLTSNLPSVDDLAGRVHGRLAAHSAVYVHVDQIPNTVSDATIITEDARFPSHTGVDFRGTLRAIFDDVTRRCLCEGGSTITQQLAKQIYLDGNDASVRRKLDTILLALEIERHYSKDEILELYLNTAYYGHGAYGVGTASEVYWRLQVGKVSLAQAALLAGLPQAPSDYDPLLHPEAARRRRAEVLNKLVSAGRISAADAQRASAQPVASAYRTVAGTIVPSPAS
jgi:membrane peptidoglycan carboxypeptidase